MDIAPEAFVGLFLGGLKPRKNVPWLLEVWRAFSVAMPGAVLLIAGDGPQRDQLIRQAAGFQSGTVRFLGRVSDVEKARLLASADVFCFPSLLEGFGLPILEAMSAGLPFVCSNRGSLPEVAHERAGFVVRIEERGPMVGALYAIAENPRLRDRMGAEGRAWAARQSWGRSARLTLAAIESLHG
jgi:glycosyltransferase involved in cell wall biosynthesis